MLTRQARTLTRTQIEAVRSFLRDRRNGLRNETIFLLSFRSGLRAMEIANLRWSHSDTVDPAAIAREHLERYARSFERLVDWDAMGELPTGQIHHSHFADFLSAPVETTSALYEALGRQLPPNAAENMRVALDASPADQHGTHRYSHEELGEDEEALRKRFARYQTRFGVPSDG